MSTGTGLRRGLRVLEVLARDEAAAQDGLGVVAIARLIGEDKSQASRALRTLADEGLVERDPATRGYRIGPRVFAYAAVVARGRLLRAAPPLLRRLVAELGERAHLSVLDGASVLTLLSESPDHAVQAVGWVGRLVPAHNTASGRALLLDAEPEELRARLAAVSFAGGRPGAPRDVDELARRLAEDGGRGYSAVDEEFEAGLVAVAAPVRGFEGRIVAALNVSAPRFRFGDRMGEAAAALTAATRELSAALGAPSGPDDPSPPGRPTPDRARMRGR